MIFSGDETTDVGNDTATPVSDDCSSRESPFAGRIRRVQIDIDDAANDADHVITAEERYRVAVAKQQPRAESPTRERRARSARPVRRSHSRRQIRTQRQMWTSFCVPFR
jgi:arylsulfatase